ncbi:MAG: M13 family metallopeptidase [Gemmatimonadales bacterium]|nr:M13 family metallopeptidase [Gemmatimonadales bacterium]
MPLPTLVRWALAALVLSSPAVAAAQQAKPLDPANMDTTCSACENFYQYANGGWIGRSTIPGDRPMWGSFHELQDQNFAALRQVLDQAAANRRSASDPNLRKLGLFYGSCMDSARVEQAGLRPLAGELGRIAAVRTRPQVQSAMARLQQRQVNPGFLFHSTPDAKQSGRTIAEISQAGLGMPDRDYYLKPDSASETLRQEYVAHVGRMLRLAGEDSASAARSGGAVMTMETALAKASMTLEAQRDPEAIYHLTDIADLRRAAPAIVWPAYFKDRGVAVPAQVNLAQPDFIRALDSLLASAPVADWRAYLRWHLLAASAPALSSAFAEESFRFNSTVLQGVKEMQPRWRRCLEATDNAVGEILGQAYVRKHFTPDAKTRALEMVRNIQAEFRGRLGALTWMSPATKAKAYRKLDAIGNKIGYPERWRDYSRLELQDQPYVLNLHRANAFEARRDLAKVNRPTDRSEWGMTPPTVNASYNPLFNHITFPAGIMQPPFFDPKADDAVNYGGMGAVIGHEITHGFDDEGRQFDAEGNLSGWWDSSDTRAFSGRAQVLERQAGGFVAVDTMRVNGKLTLGENIADLGGLLIAHGAYRRSLEGKSEPAPIEGLTGDQRFFLAWAQIWRSTIRPEFARMLVTVDPHGPAAYRTNGPVSNIPAFAQAFGCKAGEPMARKESERVQIW